MICQTIVLEFCEMQSCDQLLEAIQPEVSFGYTTIRIFRASELEPQQVGYSITPTGQSLTGDEDGDWRKNWLVIGYEDLCGDPIFIDTSQEEFPVYTAIHGEGPWEPNRIADSLVGLGRALSAIADVAKGREHPVGLENNPLTQQEKQAALAAIQRYNPNADLSFWENLLE
jgi:hypothetical protein